MATTTYAFIEAIECILDDSALDSSDDLTLSIRAKFWQNVDGTVSYNASSAIPVTFAANALLATIDDTITDAIVAHADSEWSWTLPRANCLFPQYRRGPII